MYSVHCQIGSLEIENLKFRFHFLVHCQIGSLEMINLKNRPTGRFLI